MSRERLDSAARQHTIGTVDTARTCTSARTRQDHIAARDHLAVTQEAAAGVHTFGNTASRARPFALEVDMQATLGCADLKSSVNRSLNGWITL